MSEFADATDMACIDRDMACILARALGGDPDALAKVTIKTTDEEDPRCREILVVGEMQCPHCGRYASKEEWGILKWGLYTSNGHLHLRCTRKGCIARME